jgi:cell division protein FtsZ
MLDSEKFSSNAVIKVIGVGGAGGNAINTMIEQGLSGVEFIAANTDVQALASNLAPIKIQLGRELTKGLGAGANPEVGRDAALEDKAILQEVLSGADMIFVTAGTGGGTGTGAAPIIAQVARELGALTVGVVTKPFSFEGKRRKIHSEQGIQSLKNCVDTLITIPNQRLLSIAPPQMSMLDGFKLADEVLLNAVKGISDIINIPGRVNVDFADVRTIMSEMGMALMGIGSASGENRAVEAARAAINSPLLEDVDIEGATGILINITGSSAMTLHEISEASTLIQEAVHEDANIIFGSVVDESMGENLRVTVIATGFDHARVSLPEAHNKIYPTAQNGYGYQVPSAPGGLNTHSQGYGLNHGAHNSRQVSGNSGYGNSPSDARGHGFNGAAHSSHPNQRGQSMTQGSNAPVNQNANTGTPVAAGLSLRAPYEVGQPVNTFRRGENINNQSNEAQLNSYGRMGPSNHASPSGMNTQATTHAASTSHSFGQANSVQSTHQLKQALSGNAKTEQDVHGKFSDVLAGRNTVNSGNSEFEDLTQWTLELSRQSSQENSDRMIAQNRDTNSNHEDHGLNVAHAIADDNENEKALQLARELADVIPDENDFETPAFLRRKEETTNRGL